jgi:hypothetical protein
MVKRVIVIVLAVLLCLGGGLLAVAGGALMAVFGSDNTLRSGSHPASTDTSALVTATGDINGANGFATSVDQPTLRVSVTGTGRDVFIGIGPAAAVDQYLAGSAVDKVTDLDVDPFRLRTVRQPGSEPPAPPVEQTFWTARGTGRTASIDWKIHDGSYRLVVMNADASPGVNVDGQFTLAIPHLFAIGMGLLIAGIIGLLAGVVLLIVGIRMTSRRQPSVPGSGFGVE